MLENEDIQKIIIAQKEIFPTKENFENFKTEMRGDFSNLQTSVDGYVKKVNNYSENETILSHKVNRHENWLLKIAEKVGMKLEY